MVNLISNFFGNILIMARKYKDLAMNSHLTVASQHNAGNVVNNTLQEFVLPELVPSPLNASLFSIIRGQVIINGPFFAEIKGIPLL